MPTLPAQLTRIAAGYGRDRSVLRGYLMLMAGYSAATGTGALAARSAGVRMPRDISLRDMALLSVATQRISRLITKDAVTSPVRAPFTRFAGPGSPGEVNEEVRATGAGHAVGELLTCPFCMAQWVGTALVGGLVVAPRTTRLVASVFAVASLADALHYALDALARSQG